MTKRYCDVCPKEVKKKERYFAFTMNVMRDDLVLESDRREVCQTCALAINNAVSSVMDDAKLKKEKEDDIPA